MQALECSDVSVARGGVQALQEVSVRILAGQVLGLIGPNGAGKTTLLDVLSGFLPLNSGAVYIDGVDATRLDARRLSRKGVHRTFQGSRLFSALSVEENIQLGALANGMTKSKAIQRAASLLESLELGSVRDTRCVGLPQGVAQRVVLGRALAARPRFLLLDEPVAGLSEAETDSLARSMREARNAGSGILIVEHDMRFVEQVCGRAYVLTEGTVLSEGPVSDVFSDAVVQEAYLGTVAADL